MTQGFTQPLGRASLYEKQIERFARISPIGTLIVDESTRLIGAEQPTGTTIDSNFWTTGNSGAGSGVALASTVVTCSSGTANNGYGYIQTARKARFMFGHANWSRSAVRIPTVVVANNTRRWGAHSIVDPIVTSPAPNNGFFWSLSAAGALSVNYAVGASVTSVASGSFNGEVTTYTVDTNVHAYEVIFWKMAAWFFIDGVLIHKFSPTTAILSGDFTLHFGASSVNSAGGTTDGTIEQWAGTIFRIGKESTAPNFIRLAANATTVLKRGAGRIHRVMIGIPGAAANTITLYDNTVGSGTVIANIGSNSLAPTTLEIGADFFTGLSCVIAGGASAADCTIVYD